ncbi:hypothetical protein GLOIN_2v1839297 [Rhizophagus irregularis DAOM 181602=DAOM 197198]|nr:hypothetical protein GLOIN_2v1839297 [Rhizophagus irregularis DAOM 181602=DAOM 197198]
MIDIFTEVTWSDKTRNKLVNCFSIDRPSQNACYEEPFWINLKIPKKKKMSQITPRLIYQVNLPKSLEIEEDYYSPIFGINNMFWQIFILRNDNQITELYSRSFVIPPGTHIDNGISISHLVFFF